MRLLRRSRVTNDRGVAMITVLFVGAALTVVAATASFATIQELGITNDDRLSATALGHAEAGIDRAMGAIRRGSSEGNISWLDMMLSGCAGGAPLTPSGRIGDGRFDVQVQRPVPLPSCDAKLAPLPKAAQTVNITSTGTSGTASRTVRQVVRVARTDIPIGLLTTSGVDVNGAGSQTPARVRRISLITDGPLTDREFIAFIGFDPWYTQDDFYDNGKTETCRDDAVCNATEHLPAAAHSRQVIDCQAKGPCGLTKTEHDQTDDHPVSCNSNERGTAGQSAWDGSTNGAATDGSVLGNLSCPGSTVGIPPTTKYPAPDVAAIAIPQLTEEDHQNLKTQALTSGLYCVPKACRFKGGPEQPFTGTVAGTEAGFSTLPDNFTAYFDYPAGSSPQPSVSWGASVGPCSTTTGQNKSAIIVVKNGDFSVAGGTELAGAVIAQEGTVSFAGGAGINGTVLARELVMAGNSNFRIDDCALLNLLNPFIDVAPVRWLELDRPVG